MAETQTTPDLGNSMPNFFEVCDAWHKAATKVDKFNRMLTTDAKIAADKTPPRFHRGVFAAQAMLARLGNIASNRGPAKTAVDGFCPAA